MKSRIDYNYAHFNFDWTWIRDKEIIHQGNEDIGMLMIATEDGQIVGMYGYELISKDNDNVP
jgi:hypothetical protein